MIRYVPDMWSQALYRWMSRIHPAPLAMILKRITGVRRLSLETTEGTFWIDPVSSFGQTLLQYGEYEARTARTLRGLLRPGSVFIDVGANEGYFSVVASKLVGSTGRVFALEPQSRLHPIITQNLRSNDVYNVEVRGCALGDRTGETQLHLAPDTNTGSSGFYRHTRYKLAVQAVQVMTIDEFFRRENIAECHVMKLDIEGAEYDAIMGSPDVFLRGQVRALVLETHPEVLQAQGKRETDISDLLVRCGYTRDTSFPESGVWRRPETARE